MARSTLRPAEAVLPPETQGPPRDSRAPDVRRTLTIAALVTLGVATAAIVLWDWLAPVVIERVYRDPGLGPLHDALQAHASRAPDHRDPTYYVRNGRTVLTRTLLAAIGLEIVMWALVFRRATVALLRGFFGAAGSPVNLAVFRIVLFGVILIKVGITDTVYYSELPTELRMPPLGMGWLVATVPINAEVAGTLRLLFWVVCTMAILGLLTRTSAALSLLLGAYQLGVPQIYGSMNADHHLLWFAAILSVSRCADVLSLDAVRAAWRDADRGVVAPPAPARRYALPLRFVWLLLGIVYFFPGFWKIWRAGLEWVTADNLRLHLQLKWAEFHDWSPLFRADGYPFFLFLAALGTVVFEVGFIFLVFSARGRVVATAVGLAFHNTCWALLNITFWLLQAMYVALFDWAAVFRRAGAALFPEVLLVAYDGDCRQCRRTVAALGRFDVLMRIAWVNRRDRAAIGAHGLERLDTNAVDTGLQAVLGTREWTGRAAWRAIVPRIPSLWIAWPLLGTRLYRRAAGHVAHPVMAAPPARHAGSDRSPVPVTVVGTALLLGNIGFGVAFEHMAWPLFCFPTFAWIAQPRAHRLGIEVVHPDGHTEAVDVRALNVRTERHLQPERLQGLVIAIFAEPASRRDNRLRALWELLTRKTNAFAGMRSVRFYRDTITTDPDHRGEPPLSRELLYELVPS